MLPRTGARAASVAVLLVALAALLPLAAADHAYSHRYIVYGRVVDAEGNSVPGLTVNLVPHDFQPEGTCTQQPGIDTEAFGPTVTRVVTNQFGEFIHCFHTHSMSRTLPGSATLTIPQANYTAEITFDAYTRVSFIPVKLAEARDEANRTALASTYTVYGRLWRPEGGEPQVEFVRVFGDTLHNVPVNITLTLPDGTTLRKNSTTNNYGDFAVRFGAADGLSSRATQGTVTVEAEGKSFTSDVDPAMGISTFRAEYPKETDPFLRQAGIVALVVIVGGGVIGGGIYATRRMRDRAEESKARQSSTRKRANR